MVAEKFAVGELVVLKPSVADKNYKRVYEVLVYENGKLTVEVVVENAINAKTYSQGHSNSSMLFGTVFSNIDDLYFEAFM